MLKKYSCISYANIHQWIWNPTSYSQHVQTHILNALEVIGVPSELPGMDK